MKKLFGYLILNANKRRLASLLALGVFTFNLICGTILYFIPTSSNESSVEIAAVQGNLPSQETKSTLFSASIYEIYEDLTIDAAKNGAEVVLWPEGAFVTDISSFVDNRGKLVRLDEAVSELAARLGVTIVIGSYVENKDTEEIRNSLSVFYPDGKQNIGAYSKIRLVPFGEFVPLRSVVSMVLPSLSAISAKSTDLTRGEVSSTFNSHVEGDGVEIGAMICFDSIYENLAINSVKSGAEIFIIPSNDSWFYDSRAMNLHHSQNVLRAIEQGRYTVNCANTGISSIVDDKGRVVDEIEMDTRGYVLGTVRASNYRTLYSCIGNAFVYVCIVLLFVPFVYPIIKKK